jgi:Phosphodiester glycosidase
MVIMPVLISGCIVEQYSTTAVIGPEVRPELKYETKTVPGAIVHIVTVPSHRRYQVRPILSKNVAGVDELARSNQSIVGINAGFFDPSNQQTTSHVVIDGITVADPQTNPRLIENPKLKPLLGKIFNRSEFRRYDCDGNSKYDIQPHNQPSPTGCKLVDAIGGGPGLLPELTGSPEAFWDKASGRDPIGINQPNARTAIGITATGEILLVMAAQTKIGGGINLPELGKLMTSIGAVKAMNLDGGTSSAIFSQDQLLYGKRNAANQPEGRPVKSAIVVMEVVPNRSP